ncbi:MAG: aminotransferase class I/II-fold pyridoxal phosphate-dependent enzyme [Candidatus Lariskella arthropodorum]
MTHSALYNEFCSSLKSEQIFRMLGQVASHSKSLIDFTSNDYLSLSRHPVIVDAFCKYAKEFGVGATGSRLLSGNLQIFHDLEKQVAAMKHTEAALIFSSGYQANSTALSSMLDTKVLQNQALVFFDKLNHASLYHGCMLAGAKMVRYKHCNIKHLRILIEQYKDDVRPKFIVSETLFGMDGDIVDIAELITISREFGAFLYLDDAHSTGMFGQHGHGLSSNHDFEGIDYAIMGTFSKAIGASGGYIACSNILRNYLINRCGGFIYSTAMPPALAAAILAAIALLPSLDEQRDRIMRLANALKQQLTSRGYDIGTSAAHNSHIVPIILDSSKDVVLYKDALMESKIAVSAIRPPTSPTPRLRIALMAKHSESDVEHLISSIVKNIQPKSS